MSAVRIIANQSNLTRALKISGAKIRLYVREESHYSGMSTTELVKKLSTGFQYQMSFGKRKVIVDIPPRPIFRQFFANNKDEMVAMIVESKAWKNDSQYEWDVVAERILGLFKAWVELGGVTPPNAKYTLAHKNGDAPMLDTGNMIDSIVSEATIDILK